MHSSPRWTSPLRLGFSVRGSLNLLLCPSTRGRMPDSSQVSACPSRMLSIYSSPVIGSGDLLPALTWADTFSVADTVVWMVFWRGDCDWSDVISFPFGDARPGCKSAPMPLQTTRQSGEARLASPALA